MSKNQEWARKYEEGTFVYFIRCPDTRRVRYIGMSHHPTRRLYSHRMSKSPVGDWLRGLRRDGKKPILDKPIGPVHILDASAAETRLIALTAIAFPGQLLNTRLELSSFFGRNSPILEILSKGGLTPFPISEILGDVG